MDGFGSTELAVIITREAGTPQGSIGKGFEGVAIYDSETVTECAVAVFDEHGALANADEAVGELVNTQGAGYFQGYYNDEQANQERMRHGMYWSGDLAYRDADGWIYLAGRTADWMRVDGENIAAAPVERILTRLDAINQVAVYAVPDEHVGDQVMAAIVLRDEATLTPEELEAFLAAQEDLSPKAWPRYVRIADELPSTATNKVLKRELVAQGPTAADGEELWDARGPRDGVRRGRHSRCIRSHLTSAHGRSPGQDGSGAAREDDGPGDIVVRSEDQLGLDREPGFAEPTRDRARSTTVAVDVDRTARVALGGVTRLVADVEADQEQALWSQYSTELLEHGGHGVVRHVDDGPERDDSHDRVVLQVEFGHRPDVEAELWMVAPRDGDHLGREVDPEGVHPELVEVAGDVPRPASHVGNGPASGAVHQLGEQRQAGPEEGHLVEQSTYLLGVPAGIGVVRRAGVGQPGISHGGTGQRLDS